MGTVFKKTVTKPLPAGAEIITRKGEPFARWKDANGRSQTLPLTTGNNGQDRIVLRSSKYYAKYRDGFGIIRVVPTGCRDETAARQVLADLERRAELIRSGVMSAAEAGIGRHQATPLEEHFDAFDEHLQAKGDGSKHRKDTARYLRSLAAECSFATLADLRREPLERWLAARAAEGMSARSRNAYRNAIAWFCRWCVATDRLIINPFAAVARANEKADPRHQRRAMTEDELLRLLDATCRPLVEAMTIRNGSRKGQVGARLRQEVRNRLELRCRERALTYKTLVISGLRRGELASLTVAQLSLEGPAAYAVLNAKDEKNREGSEIVLRDDLVADLKEWLAGKLVRLQSEARRLGKPIPTRLPPETKVFDVPVDLYRILAKDLQFAGIPKRDERGRVLDVHALRTTFGTLLSRGGVSPRTAQAAMRHSDIRLTMGVYTDPKLLDVRGALNVLPALPVNAVERQVIALRATGTCPRFAPGFAPTQCKPVQSMSVRGKSGVPGAELATQGTSMLTAGNFNGSGSLATADNGGQPSGEISLSEPPAAAGSGSAAYPGPRPGPRSEYPLRSGPGTGRLARPAPSGRAGR
jgi:integrase